MKIKAFIGVFLVLLSFKTLADQATVAGTSVGTIIVTAEKDSQGNALFGGCMLNLNQSISATTGLSSCAGNWVSLSCSGDFNSRSDASQLLNIAQMAKALEKNIDVRVDDTEKHNGYCVAKRIQLK